MYIKLVRSFTVNAFCFLQYCFLQVKRLRVSKAIFLFSLIVFTSVMTTTNALDLLITGGWSVILDSTDLVSGAGSNLTSQYESSTDQVLVDIYNSAGGGDTWRVDISKSDISWNNSLSVYCKRTSSGTGGSVAGGSSYLGITNIDQQFFTGSDNVTGIGFQYKLDGVSVSIPPAVYSTSIVFTVVDT
jgi:hypothetical protein